MAFYSHIEHTCVGRPVIVHNHQERNILKQNKKIFNLVQQITPKIKKNTVKC